MNVDIGWNYTVVLAIFSEHSVYCDTFELMMGPKEKAVWGKKIKNWIQMWVIAFFLLFLSLNMM